MSPLPQAAETFIKTDPGSAKTGINGILMGPPGSGKGTQVLYLCIIGPTPLGFRDYQCPSVCQSAKSHFL